MTETEQVWVYNGVEFKVGDEVLIAFSPVNGSAGEVYECHPFFVKDGMGTGTDWDNVWVEGMDCAVGGVHDIESIDETGVEFVEYVDYVGLHPHGGYRYPLSILKKQYKQ